MSNVFGSCLDKHTLWEEGTDAQGNPTVTFTSNVEGQDPVTLCLNPLKGATLNGEAVPIEDGILVLEDMFGEGVVDAVADTYTITLPGQEPVVLCLTPVKGITGDGVDNADPHNPVIMGTTVTDQANGLSGIVEDFKGDACEFLKASAYNPSSTVPDELGVFHAITTSDNVTTNVCLRPLKSINGIEPDINGNVNVADLFSNTVDNGDGTFTTTNSDGTEVTWSGDTFAEQMDNGDGTVTFTMADGSTVTLCLNPVKSVVQNEDGLGATVTYADGTTGALTYPAVTTSSFTSNGDGTTTHSDGNGNDTSNIQEDIDDGGSNILAADGVTINPLLDCNAAPIDVEDDSSRFMIYSQVADLGVVQRIKFVDSGDGCSPAEPDAKLVEVFGCLETVNPKGDQWEYNTSTANAWECVQVAYDQTIVPFTNINRTVTTAELQAFRDANGNAEESIIFNSRTIRNDDCVPLCYRAFVRSSGQFTGVSPNNQWNIQLLPSAADTTPTPWVGGPASIIDTTNEVNIREDQKDLLHMENVGVIQPGDEVTFEICALLQLLTFNNPAGSIQRVTFGGFSGRIELSRCKGGDVVEVVTVA